MDHAAWILKKIADFLARMKAYKKIFNLYFWLKVEWPLADLEIELDFFLIFSYNVKMITSCNVSRIIKFQI